MAYIAKHHVGTACIFEVYQIKFWGYGVYNMPHVNNVIFLKENLPIFFSTQQKIFWEAKIAFSERIEHSQ